jgi:competence protein ComEC
MVIDEPTGQTQEAESEHVVQQEAPVMQQEGPNEEIPETAAEESIIGESVVEESAVEEVIVEEAAVEPTETQAANMEVHYIDVGQGDATLIKADEQYMLIDAGDNEKGSTVQLYLQKQGVEKLDYLVLTHTDADHIGGADVIVTKFDIDTVFMGDFKKDNKTYEELVNALDYKGLTYTTPEVGNEYQLGKAFFTIVAPNKEYNDSNNNSIALLLENGDNTFLFTGDCEEEAEKDILTNGLSLACDVYKLGHHGSNTSSSKAFLNAVAPTYGVISCAEGNSYGYPHAEPMNHLRSMGVQMFRTDEQGSIIAYSDGTEITWNCAPSESWQVGEKTQSSIEKAEVETTVISQEVVEEETVAESQTETQTEPQVESQTEPQTEPQTESQAEPQEAVVPTPAPEPAPIVVENEVEEPQSEPSMGGSGSYAVNGKNGKIHIVGECPATGDGKNAMKNPVYFNTYEEAENYSVTIDPGLDKRKCGNCW